MRVVAGEARGRRLEAPRGRDVRPTTDRVREALFNTLVSLDVLDGAIVVDLFAGTGALGIEALSRGAARCTFVERDARARAIVERNLDTTGFADRATVVGDRVESWVERAVADRVRVDLALLDPPYAYDGWDDLLPMIPASVVVVESDRDVPLPPSWRVVRRKRYGSTLVVTARTGAAGPAGGRAVGDDTDVDPTDTGSVDV